MELMGHIENIHQNSRKLYGAPRVTEAMKNLGLPVSRRTVSRWMSEAGLAAKTNRRFRVVTTDSNHKLPLPANILDRQFSPAEPGAVLASDITYIATMEGWLYLTITQDPFGRRVVGWRLDSTMEEKLVLNALTMALGRTDMRVGAIDHSDRGSQYAANEFRKLLAAKQLRQSMSRKGNCWDNAPTESLFHNRERLHSTLG